MARCFPFNLRSLKNKKAVNIFSVFRIRLDSTRNRPFWEEKNPDATSEKKSGPDPDPTLE